jgi:hypothetical protein
MTVRTLRCGLIRSPMGGILSSGALESTGSSEIMRAIATNGCPS